MRATGSSGHPIHLLLLLFLFIFLFIMSHEMLQATASPWLQRSSRAARTIHFRVIRSRRPGRRHNGRLSYRINRLIRILHLYTADQQIRNILIAFSWYREEEEETRSIVTFCSVRSSVFIFCDVASWKRSGALPNGFLK